MKTTGLTLAEALATGRPFKHKSWVGFVDMRDMYSVTIGHHEFYSKHWQVQEEEKPPMRVYRCITGAIHVLPKSETISGDLDITESLAKALAPYIKKELGL